MKKCKWTQCPPPTEKEQEDFVQIYEFIRIPHNADSLAEIRVFFDLAKEEFFRLRKYVNGNLEWWKTNPYHNVEEV